jgi:flavin-dependent dehydrogenase
VFLLGDAAGAIAPLCGNGMSMAMRASFLLAKHIPQYLDQEITKEVLIQNYTSDWNKHFSTRIKTGYYLQKLFGKRLTTLLALKLMKNNPNLLRKIISLTHGEKF